MDMSYERQLYLSGFAQVLTGCVLGVVPSSQWKIPRYALTSHIEFTAHGALLCCFAASWKQLVLSPNLQRTLFVLSNIGTWLPGTAFLVANLLNETTEFTPIINSQIEGKKPELGKTGTALLIVAGLAIIPALAITCYGLLSKPPLLQY